MLKQTWSIAFLFLLISYQSFAQIDSRATKETKNLYRKLKSLSSRAIIFGHQNAHMEGKSGSGWLFGGFDSDIKQLTGDDPSLAGGDLESIFCCGKHFKKDFRNQLIAAYNRGEIITLSWHAGNFVTGKGMKDTTPIIHQILPGKSHYHLFKSKLDTIAEFLNSLRGRNGELIPVIFRPWHEHNGNWFWWSHSIYDNNWSLFGAIDGRLNADAQFRALWHHTVDYLKNTKGIHNLLYAYSPNASYSGVGFNYMYRYPGDNYVDIFGVDVYPIQAGKYYQGGIYGYRHQLAKVVQHAKRRGKVAAITETGTEGIRNKNFWTQDFARLLKLPSLRKLAYVMLWRNSWGKDNHYYVPFKGEKSASDFLTMKSDPYFYFLKDLPYMY